MLEKTIEALERLYNNANILVLPGRFISADKEIEIVKVFLSTKFEGGRHQKRVDMIVQNIQSSATILKNGLLIRNHSLKRYKQLQRNSKLILRKN